MTVLTQSAEDYLEAIYVLARDTGRARISDIAIRLGVSKPSVVAAVRSLREEGMVRQEPYGAVELTPAGLSRSREVYERHLKIADFLVRILGVSPEAAEKDACAMEHFLQPETLQRMIDYMSER